VCFPCRFAALLCSVAAITSAGCGKSTGLVKPKGKIIRNGAPLIVNTEGLPPGDRGLHVVFSRQDGDKGKEEYPTKVDVATGTFEAVGQNGKGIPRGKYSITIQLGAMIAKEEPGPNQPGREHWTVEREVTGNDEIIIDVDRPDG
jgi:hypothetical protein